jgi:hypothetical protein
MVNIKFFAMLANRKRTVLSNAEIGEGTASTGTTCGTSVSAL